MLIPDQTATEVKKIDIRTDSSVKAVVELSILDRSKYTSVVAIEQKPELKWGANPRLKVRLYHDTKSAEVIEYQDQNRFRSHYDFPNKRMRQTDEKVQLNLFLGEYLSAGGVFSPHIDLVALPAKITQPFGLEVVKHLAERLSDVLGWVPTTSLFDGLSAQARWHAAQSDYDPVIELS